MHMALKHYFVSYLVPVRNFIYKNEMQNNFESIRMLTPNMDAGLPVPKLPFFSPNFQKLTANLLCNCPSLFFFFTRQTATSST
jgi:hypothetical protein